MARLFSRNVGGLRGSERRAASTTQSLLIFSLVLTLSYSVFLMTYDLQGLADLTTVNMVAATVYGIGIIVVRVGKQTLAAMLAFVAVNAHVLLTVESLGWQSGVHLFLIASGQLVFMVFTERQRWLRAWFVLLAALTFLYCQWWAELNGSPFDITYDFPDSVLSLLFSINAVITAALMYMLAAVAHTRARTARAMAAEAAARAEFLANTDALTGLSNRRPVMEHLEILGRADETQYCVALADLDHFKALNDEYGHVCGDRVLATLGDRLRHQVRATDSVGRWGGEEFIFVMPDLTLNDAARIMDRIREAVGGHVVPCSGHSHHVTMSVGVSCRPPGAKSHRVIKRADDALYEAKQSGRDMVRSLHSVPADALPQGYGVPINPDGGEGHRPRRPGS